MKILFLSNVCCAMLDINDAFKALLLTLMLSVNFLA